MHSLVFQPILYEVGEGVARLMHAGPTFMEELIP